MADDRVPDVGAFLHIGKREPFREEALDESAWHAVLLPLLFPPG
jgi:hypothetical protein